MDYREDQFKKKFADVARQFGVHPHEVVSLKLRDTVGSYTEYSRLLQTIEHEVGIHYAEVKGNLQGRGYLLEDGKNKIIIVEHETGLEILYIAGSVASIIGLVPVVLQCWRGIRGKMAGRHFVDEPIEIRRLDRDGHLYENHESRAFAFVVTPAGFSSALTPAAILLENEMKVLVTEVRNLAARVERLEKPSAARTKVKKPRKLTKPAH